MTVADKNRLSQSKKRKVVQPHDQNTAEQNQIERQSAFADFVDLFFGSQADRLPRPSTMMMKICNRFIVNPDNSRGA